MSNTLKLKQRNKIPKAGAKEFTMEVLPQQDKLDAAIEAGAFCNAEACWHYLEVAAVCHHWDESGNHHVRVDAGQVKLNLFGWRYEATTPLHVKRTLMLFDVKRYKEIKIKGYTLKFRRTTRIIPIARERQDQINVARRARKNAGHPDRNDYRDMHKRVVGFSVLV